MSNTIKKSIINTTSSGFARRWGGNKNMVQVMSDVLNNQTYMDNLKFLFQNPSEFFVSLIAYPFDVRRYFYPSTMQTPQSKIRLGSTNITYKGNEVSAFTFPVGTYYKWICSFTISRRFNNFLDYSPYTKIELYVPFCAFVTLDNTVVMGHEIRLFYSVDWSTGGLTAYIVKHTEKSDDLIQTVQGQIGFELPLGSSNRNEKMKQQLQADAVITGSVIGSVITGNPLPLILGSIGFVSKTIDAQTTNVTKGTSGSGSNALVSPKIPYVIYTYYEPTIQGEVNEEYYRQLKGKPLNEVKKLSDVDGFTKCSNVHVEIENATSGEVNQIESLLQSGIII